MIRPASRVVSSAVRRPILAADDHDLGIDDDTLVVNMRLDT
jgi:hypothetical protein